jgi:hypothetical protein
MLIGNLIPIIIQFHGFGFNNNNNVYVHHDGFMKYLQSLCQIHMTNQITNFPNFFNIEGASLFDIFF